MSKVHVSAGGRPAGVAAAKFREGGRLPAFLKPKTVISVEALPPGTVVVVHSPRTQSKYTFTV